MIKYIQFMPGISISVGTFKTTSMEGYSIDKHGKEMDVEENSAGVEFWIKKDDKRTGERIRVPRSAIASIRETVEGKKP